VLVEALVPSPCAVNASRATRGTSRALIRRAFAEPPGAIPITSSVTVRPAERKLA